MKNLKIALVASAVAFVVAGNVHAAGALDSESADVRIIKDDIIDLSGIDNVDLGTVSSLTAAATGEDLVCVFASTGAYSITASSPNAAGGVFRMESGGNFLEYDLDWGVGANTGDVNTAAFDLVPGIASSGSLVADNASPTCGGGTNAGYMVSVAPADFNAAPTGTYVDTVTLLVTSL